MAAVAFRLFSCRNNNPMKFWVLVTADTLAIESITHFQSHCQHWDYESISQPTSADHLILAVYSAYHIHLLPVLQHWQK